MTRFGACCFLVEGKDKTRGRRFRRLGQGLSCRAASEHMTCISVLQRSTEGIFSAHILAEE